jgi:hypothetical protein
VKNWIKINIQINHYIHVLTLDEEQHEQWGMFKEYYLCTSTLCTSEILFFEYENEQQFLSITPHILLSLYLDVLFQEQMNIKIYNYD